MSEQLSPNAAGVLKALQGVVQRVVSAKPQPGSPDYRHHFRCWSADARQIGGGIPSRMAVETWAGGIAGTNQRKCFWRAVTELESHGLIERRRQWGGRTTHLMLPEAQQ